MKILTINSVVFQEFGRAFKAWRSKAAQVNYRQFFPVLRSKIIDGKNVDVDVNEELDLVADLMTIPIGKIYQDLLKDPKFGYLPLMAKASKGQIGTLNAESFCERCLSCANLVMTDGNTLLSDEETGMLTCLRMNESFMDYMRNRSPKVSRQRLNQTIVSLSK